jgi:hypothetical protein
MNGEDTAMAMIKRIHLSTLLAAALLGAMSMSCDKSTASPNGDTDTDFTTLHTISP